MTDLIASLAARAAGRESALTPVVGSLYGETALSGWEALGLAEELQEVLVRPARERHDAGPGEPVSRPAVAPERLQPGPRVEPVRSAAEADRAPASQPSRRAESRPSPPAAPALPASGARPLPRPGGTDLPARGTTSPTGSGGHSGHHQVDRVTASAAAEEAAITPTATLPAVLARTASRQAGGPAGIVPAGDAIPERGDPPPMLEPEPRGESRRWTGPATGRTRPLPAPTQGAVGELETADETVVTVNIGRIELRSLASPAPAAQRQPAAAARPFPSLDEYLDRTSEGHR